MNLTEFKVLSVTELNRALKDIIEGSGLFSALWVKGEITNFKHHSSGHMYFSLGDQSSKVRCVMFKHCNSELKFTPEEGLSVLVFGEIGVYERSGDYQLYVSSMEPAGRGAQQLALEQLRQRLASEGLFDAVRKRAIPLFPARIAVVTSPTGAAIKDIMSIISRRWPCCEIIVIPCLVQGDTAPDSIAESIRKAQQIIGIDVMIVGRGGGSSDDLAAFNDEKVVRAIADSSIPVISAVGHEIDYTLSDLAADMRAPTPSAAAELAVPNLSDIKSDLDELKLNLNQSIQDLISSLREQTQYVWNLRPIRSPQDMIRQIRLELDGFYDKLESSLIFKLRIMREQLAGMADNISVLSPLGTLSRGYAVCRKKDGKVAVSVSELSLDEELNISIKDGDFSCIVTNIRKEVSGS